MTIFFAFLTLAGVILFGLGAKGIVLARAGRAGGALASVLTLVLGIAALLIGAVAAIACLAIVTPNWSFFARWVVLVMLAALSAGAQIRRALPACAAEACAPTYWSSWHDDDDDDWLPQINPSSGLPMMPGGGIDIGGNSFMHSSDDD